MREQRMRRLKDENDEDDQKDDDDDGENDDNGFLQQHSQAACKCTIDILPLVLGNKTVKKEVRII